MPSATNIKIPYDPVPADAKTTAKSPLSHFGETMRPRTFFLLLFLFQFLLIFQGFDLTDEGFLSIFYQQIFSKPQSVSYNFMFWLTGIIGGAWLKLFPSLGLLGIRFAGVLVNMASVMIVYNLLKPYLKPGHLKLGILLVVLAMNNDIKVLNYNTLSSLFFLTAIHFLFSGMKTGRLLKIATAGVVVGLNVFIRPPNVLELGLLLGICYFHYLYRSTLLTVFRHIVLFLIGVVAAVSIVFAAMSLLGHWRIYLDSLKLLYQMGKGNSGAGVINGGYGIFTLFYLLLSNTIQSLKYALYVLLSTTICLVLHNYSKKKSVAVKNLVSAFIFLIVAFAVLLIINHKLDHFSFLFFMNGMLLLTAVVMAIFSKNKEINVLYFFGCFFLLSFPLGSSGGIFTAGRYCLWLALPVAVDYLFNITTVVSQLSLQTNEIKGDVHQIFGESQMATTRKILFGICVVAGFYHAYFYPFFDRHNRALMHYPLQSENLKGIYTTKGRAEAFNQLLKQSAIYVKPGDYVIAYDHLAMYYYATNTVSFLHNPLSSIYNENMFQADLISSCQEHNRLPVIIQQKIMTNGEGSKWPEELYPGDYFENPENLPRNKIFDDFLFRNRYTEAWSDKYFRILLPGLQQPNPTLNTINKEATK